MSQEMHDTIFTAWLLGEADGESLKHFAPLFYGYPKWLEELSKPLDGVKLMTQEQVDKALDAVEAVMDAPGDVIVFDSLI